MSEIPSPETQRQTHYPWKRNLYILWSAQFIALVGMSSCVPYLPLYIRELGTFDPEQVKIWSGFIQAGPFILSIMATPLWGAIGDRYGRKLMVVRAVFGLALAMFLMGFAQNVWQLLGLRLLQGGISGFIAAALAYISAMTPDRHAGYAIGFLQNATFSGIVFGPLLGGVIGDYFGLRALFFFDAALCFISGILVLIFVERDHPAPGQKRVNTVTDNLRFVAGVPLLRKLLLFIALIQCGMVFTQPIFVLYLEELGAPSAHLKTIAGALIGGVGVFSAVFAPFWGRRNDKTGYTRTIRLAAAVVAVAQVLQSLAPEYYYLFPLGVVIGIFSSAFIPSLYSELSKRTPAEIRGGVLGLASSATVFGNLVSPILGGIAAAYLGTNWCFIIAAGFLVLVFVALSQSRSNDRSDVGNFNHKS